MELQDKIGYVSKGLSKENIKKIKKIVYEKNESAETCSVCFNEY